MTSWGSWAAGRLHKDPSLPTAWLCLTVAAVVGLVVGWLLTDVSLPDGVETTSSTQNAFYLWRAAITVLLASSFAFTVTFFQQARELWEFADCRRRRKFASVVPALVILAAMFVPFIFAREAFSPPAVGVNSRIIVLYVLGAPVLMAALCVMDFACIGVQSLSVERYYSHAFSMYSRFRAAVEAVFLSLALIVSLIVLATVAYVNLIQATSPDDPPVEAAILFGGWFVAVLLLIHAPAAVVLRRSARRLVARAVPIPAEPQSGLTDVLDQRRKLEQHLGLGGTVWKRLEQAAVLLSPLVTGVITTLLSAR